MNRSTGSFDWTTDDPKNSYVDKDGLHIVPTTTLESTDITYEQLIDGYTLNLTADGTCTNIDQRLSELTKNDPCVAVSNKTKSQIINPVRSARLTTAGKKTIKYGRVEVVAKLPAGDWLWPAIWCVARTVAPSVVAAAYKTLHDRLMPQNNVYGEWPRSGEIDIMESRGNDAETYPIGNNIVTSALHWGTTYLNDAWRLSAGEWGSKRTKYSEGFHTYGLEWSEKYLFTWLDGRLRVGTRKAPVPDSVLQMLTRLFPSAAQQILFFDFTKNKNLWTCGEFAGTTVNGTAIPDPWSQTGRPNSPFDQPFYLILNVAVGGTGGWFP